MKENNYVLHKKNGYSSLNSYLIDCIDSQK